MNPGHVYILINEAMPGLVKIGRTFREVDARAAELWQTGVPHKFEVFWSCKTPDCVRLEGLVHRELRECRVSKSREFFKIDEFEAQKRIRFWAEVQAQEWVSDHFSEYCAVHASEISATFGLDRLAKATNRKVTTVADALAEITEDELSPSLERVLSRRRQEQIDMLKEIGIPEDEWEGLIQDE